jgi:hypothetical protein
MAALCALVYTRPRLTEERRSFGWDDYEPCFDWPSERRPALIARKADSIQADAR